MKAPYNLSTLLILTVAFLPCPAPGQSATGSAAMLDGEQVVEPGTLITRSFEHDRRTRTYKLYVPASYDGQEEWPLLLSFHGQTQSNDIMRGIDRFTLIADTAHFLVAYPQGLNTPQPQFPGAGRHEAVFDAAGLPSGLYFYRLQAGDYTETKSLILASSTF